MKDAPKIFLTVGISGSGKSHFAKKFCQANDVVELNLDNFRKLISGDISNQDVTFEAIKGEPLIQFVVVPYYLSLKINV